MAGNTTNPYLTKKAQEKRRLSISVVAACTIFGLGAASAGIDLFREGKTLSGVMAVLLLAADMRRSVFCCTFGFFNGNPSSFPAAPAAPRRCLGI